MTAPWVLDGPMNGDAFCTCVEHILAPTLKQGDVLLLDNLPAHKVAGVREAIAASHAQVFYLPPYSPDMNPIEMAFSRLKALLRQEPARTIDALVNRIGNLLDRFLPTECANFSMQQDINAQSENALGGVDELVFRGVLRSSRRSMEFWAG